MADRNIPNLLGHPPKYRVFQDTMATYLRGPLDPVENAIRNTVSISDNSNTHPSHRRPLYGVLAYESYVPPLYVRRLSDLLNEEIAGLREPIGNSDTEPQLQPDITSSPHSDAQRLPEVPSVPLSSPVDSPQWWNFPTELRRPTRLDVQSRAELGDPWYYSQYLAAHNAVIPTQNQGRLAHYPLTYTEEERRLETGALAFEEQQRLRVVARLRATLSRFPPQPFHPQTAIYRRHFPSNFHRLLTHVYEPGTSAVHMGLILCEQPDAGQHSWYINGSYRHLGWLWESANFVVWGQAARVLRVESLLDEEEGWDDEENDNDPFAWIMQVWTDNDSLAWTRTDGGFEEYVSKGWAVVRGFMWAVELWRFGGRRGVRRGSREKDRRGWTRLGMK